MESRTTEVTGNQEQELTGDQAPPPARRPYRSPRLYQLGLLETASGDRYEGVSESGDPWYAPS